MLGAAATAAVLGATLAQAAAVPGQGTWESTLQARELDGNPLNGPEAFYDTALDITWLRDANANGPMRWNEGNSAYAWATALVVGGIGGWRLPTMVDTGEPGCDYSFAGGSDCGFNVQTATSEMAHLWYVALGNKAYCPPGDPICAGGPQPGWGLTNTGNFQELQAYNYWSGLAYAPGPGDAWVFDFNIGLQYHVDEFGESYALAVHPGDVIPEPQTYALLLTGLGAVLLARKRRRR